jgi:hypothetical protein
MIKKHYVFGFYINCGETDVLLACLPQLEVISCSHALLALLALRKTSFHGEFLILWTWTLLYSSTAFFSPTLLEQTTEDKRVCFVV